MNHDLQIVLVEPEIPQNTGTIGRLCLAASCVLHLVEPLGFEITDAHLKRAGLDYWEHLKVIRHRSFEEFLKTMPENAPRVLLSKKAGKTHFEHHFEKGTYLIFGKETAGLPEWHLEANAKDCIRIPMFDARVRSLNLSNAVSIVTYEAIRQIGLNG